MRACVYMDVANFTHVGDPADGRRVRRADLGRALALPFCWGLEIVRAVAALPRFDPDGPGLTTAGDFIIIYFSHEALGLGSSAGDQLYHCLAVVSGGEAPCPCPPIAYWDNPGRSASPRRRHGALRPSVLR